MVDGCTWHALGKVHQGKLLLGVRANDKIFHIRFALKITKLYFFS